MPYPENIPSNSISKNFGKNEPKKEYRVLPDNMKVKKKEKGFLMSIILPEDIPDIKTYLMSQRDGLARNIIWPKIQQMLMESFAMLIGMGSQIKRDNNSGGLIPKVSYKNAYNYQNIPTSTPPKGRSYTLYKDICLPSEAACKEFKEIITDIFQDQGYVTVLQYMNTAGETTYPDQANFGWNAVSQIQDMDYHYTVDGYVVTIPRPTPLDI